MASSKRLQSRKACAYFGSAGFTTLICPRDYTEAEFLDEIQKKVLKVFLLATQSHLYSFALIFLFLQTLATSISFYSALWKTTPPSLWFKKSVQKPQVWELSRLGPETSKKLYAMNPAYVQVTDNYDCQVELFFQCTLFTVLLIKWKISLHTEHLPSESAIRWEDCSAFWHHGSPSTYQNRWILPASPGQCLPAGTDHFYLQSRSVSTYRNRSIFTCSR